VTDAGLSSNLNSYPRGLLVVAEKFLDIADVFLFVCASCVHHDETCCFHVGNLGLRTSRRRGNNSQTDHIHERSASKRRGQYYI